MNKEIDVLKLYNAKSIKPETDEEVEEFYKEDVGYKIESAVIDIVRAKTDTCKVKNISIVDFNRILGIKNFKMYKVSDDHYFAFIDSNAYHMASDEEKLVVVTYDILEGNSSDSTNVDINIELSCRFLKIAFDTYEMYSDTLRNVLTPFIDRGLTLDETRICLEAVGNNLGLDDIESAVWMRALYYLDSREYCKES